MDKVDQYKKFMLESNNIEGENEIHPRDIEAVEYVVNVGIENVDDLLILHKMIGEYLEEGWVGNWRNCQVYIGDHVPPPAYLVPSLMMDFMNRFHEYNSWEAHNRFETIHPFRDLNGRMGRLIWLSKALDEGYKFQIPFLQMYYYQTLQHQQDRNTKNYDI
jgi:Fic family protein